MNSHHPARSFEPATVNLVRTMTFLLIGLLGLTRWVSATPPQTTTPDIPTAELIRKIASNESRLRDEFKRYLFKQDVTLQTIGAGKVVTGEFRRVSEIIVNDQGNREERITYFPTPTLTSIRVTQHDYQDLAGVQPFALTLEALPKYQVNYVGRERVDELNTYVFDVRPTNPPHSKKLSERFFEGRIWVDTVDLVVVKVAGHALPEDDQNKFPRFECWRENIAKGIWFPTYIYADDFLNFPNGPVHIRMVVKYSDYRVFSGDIEVIEAEPDTTIKPRSPNH